MTEHWNQFWTTHENGSSEGSIKLASTTDTQAALDAAVDSDWRGREDTEGLTHTSIGESIVGPDGSLEHGTLLCERPDGNLKSNPCQGRSSN